MIAGCKACSDTAEIPFDNILDRVTGCDLTVTDYIFEVPPIKKTLVDPTLIGD